ncbi:hypothetical protein Efla_005178 [Eimeria flavescens]
MADRTGGPLSFAFSSLEPVFRMHAEAGLPAAPYSEGRSRLELDSFVRLYSEKRSLPWSRSLAKRGGASQASRSQPETEEAAEEEEGAPSPSPPVQHAGPPIRSTEDAKRRALASYVLGVEPPAGRLPTAPEGVISTD